MGYDQSSWREKEHPIQQDINALKIDRSGSDSRAGRRWVWILLAVVLLVAMAGAAFWWSSSESAPAPSAMAAGSGPGVDRSDETTGLNSGGASAGASARASATATASDATILNASGYVTARRRATISSKITGKVTKVLVEEGMPVEAGQVLARLDDALFQANLALAQSRLAAARQAVVETASRRELAGLTLERTRRLLEEGVVGQAAFDEASTQYNSFLAREALDQDRVVVAQRQVSLRETELDDTVVRAPYSGIVISKDAQEGEMVSPVSAGGGFTRTGICTIVDMSSLEIEVDVNESYIARVKAGQPVEAVLDAYPEWRIPGHVITTIPAADRQKATVRVRIAFDELDVRILPDMGVKVAFQRE